MVELIAIVTLAALLIVRELASQHERRDWCKERQLLLTRIQAPAVAVQQHTLEDAPASPPAAPPHDDDAYWRAVEERTA